MSLPFSKFLRTEKKNLFFYSILDCSLALLAKMCGSCTEPCAMSQMAMPHLRCLPQVTRRRVVVLRSLNHTGVQHWTLGWKGIHLKIGTYLLRPSRNLLQHGADPRAPLLRATFWILLFASHLLLWAKKSFSANMNPTLYRVQSPTSWIYSAVFSTQPKCRPSRTQTRLASF